MPRLGLEDIGDHLDLAALVRGVDDLERRDALAVRIAGLGEQALGRREIEALGAGRGEARVEEEAHRRVDRAVGRRAAAELRLLDVALAVERLGDREAHLEALLLHQLVHAAC